MLITGRWICSGGIKLALQTKGIPVVPKIVKVKDFDARLHEGATNAGPVQRAKRSSTARARALLHGSVQRENNGTVGAMEHDQAVQKNVNAGYIIPLDWILILLQQ